MRGFARLLGRRAAPARLFLGVWGGVRTPFRRAAIKPQKKWVICQILSVKQNLDRQTRNNTTPIYINQTLDHRHQYSMSMFLFHHVQSTFSSENTKKR
jgi:flagellar assembly factor FliW